MTATTPSADTKQNIAILLYRVDELQRQVTNVASEIECEFKEVRTALKGNGKPGIEQRTADLERQMKMLADAIEKQSSILASHFAEHSADRDRIEEERRAVEKERRDTVNKMVVAAVSMVITNVGVIITAAIMYRLGLP